jgi:hypothetical protein
MFGINGIDSLGFLPSIDRPGATCQARRGAVGCRGGQRGILSAYVLIQTEVGKVAHVARALSDLDGAQLAEDLAGPDDIIARGPGARSGSAGPAGGLAHPGRGRRHPHPDLPGAPR